MILPPTSSIIPIPPGFTDSGLWLLPAPKRLFKQTLIKDIDRSSFSGLPKPKPLKSELSGYCSRRINNEHHLVYKVTNDEIIIIAYKYHYE
ncbi:Txe/YoeB family addiction module toxin [Okeania sp.]|uniref:Txe/YoeB family addiction module toxin n=1 Tax=Okeania sp. TaxID=3100323 RepID=UPI002B4AC10F|nr:Txe/YoeB family addiction module toxin [Okeania sp.]MEB3340326.1 Txe/YoeB family addiction module toxin [Okeania sp.]